MYPSSTQRFMKLSRMHPATSLAVQWLRLHTFNARSTDLTLFRELRFHVLYSTAKKRIHPLEFLWIHFFLRLTKGPSPILTRFSSKWTFSSPPPTFCPTTKSESEVAQSSLTLCDPMDCSPPGSSIHGIFPGKNTGVGCHFLLQEIFLTQGLNPGLPHCRQMLYQLRHQVSPTTKTLLNSQCVRH